MKSFAYPYPNLFPFIEKKSFWKYSLNGDNLIDFNEPIKSWDYKSSLKISCNLSWDIVRTFSKANLSELIKYSKLSFILISGAGGKYGITRKKVAEFSLKKGIDPNKFFSFDVASPNQSSVIKFRLIVHTDEDDLNINNFKYQKGCILYDEFETLVLEGQKPIMSLQSIDFEEKFKNAMWFVEFKPESLHQNFINSYTLYLNSRKRNLVDQLKKVQYLKDSIKIDIIYTIISSVFANSDEEPELEFDINEDYDENTLGYQLKDWLNGFDVNNQSEINEIKNLIKFNPGNFRRICQDIFCTNDE